MDELAGCRKQIVLLKSICRFLLQCGRTRSSHLPTTRAPGRCWWGASMPQEMGGTPEQPGRTCWGVRGEEKWRPDRTGTPEGWVGEGRGSHTWRDPQGLGGSVGSTPSVSLPNQAWGSLLGSRARASTL